MTSTNPDFRGLGVDEQVVPPVDDVRAICGWNPDDLSEVEAIDREERAFDAFERDAPAVFRARPSRMMPAIWEKWNEFQRGKGRYEGSQDWSLLDEFVAGQPLLWRPQIIGSCVMSNTFRGHVIRTQFQTALRGDPSEYFGREEFGTNNWSYYAAWSYGMARRRANMRGGDGLYCEPMAESLNKDGVLLCSTPQLIELTTRLRVNRPQDYPEPQSAQVYRAFGRWAHLDDLKPYACCPVQEILRPRNAQQLWDMVLECKTAFVCSMEAIHRVGQHPDGFPIHARNPRNSWAHNMMFHGVFVASDGERFFRQSNECWGGAHIYNRRFDEVESSFRARRYAIAAIGECELPGASPPPLPTS